LKPIKGIEERKQLNSKVVGKIRQLVDISIFHHGASEIDAHGM